MMCECYISTIIYWYENIKMKFSILYSVYMTRGHQNNLKLKTLGSTEKQYFQKRKKRTLGKNEIITVYCVSKTL